MALIEVARIDGAALSIDVSVDGQVTGIVVVNSRPSGTVKVKVMRNGAELTPASGGVPGSFPPGTKSRNLQKRDQFLYDDPNDPNYDSGMTYSLVG